MKKTLKETLYSSMPIIRIAPVCNGKIYVVPHLSSNTGDYAFDIPIQEQVENHPSTSDKTAKKIKDRYQAHIHTNEQPRFSVKYQTKSQEKDIVYLYILPLQKEEDIHFSHGQFMTAEEIQDSKQRFSPQLQEESELLVMAAELWNDFYTGMNQ